MPGMNLGHHFEALTESISTLIGLHIKLARLEVIEDAKALGARSVTLLAVVPVAWAAFLLLTGALVAVLLRVWPVDFVLLVVGASYAALATAGVLAVKHSLRKLTPPLNDSAAEIANTLAVASRDRPSTITAGSLTHG